MTWHDIGSLSTRPNASGCGADTEFAVMTRSGAATATAQATAAPQSWPPMWKRPAPMASSRPSTSRTSSGNA